MTAIERAQADIPATAAGIGAFAYFGGEVVPIADASVSIATNSFNYGTSVFEGIRAYLQDDGRTALLFVREHYERLLRNARLLRASVPESADALVEITLDLLRRNLHGGDVYVRPLVYKSAPSIRVQLSGLDDRVAIFTMPLGDYLPTGGIRVTVSGWQRVADNAIPARGKISGSYVNAAFAAEDAHAGGYDDAILLTSDGHVAEASAANIFVVTGSEVATPPLVDDVLPGITRGAVMQIARDAGYQVAERRIDRSELYVADEVFLTGTGVQVAPIASIDDRPIGTDGFPISLDIQRRYFAAVRGTDPRYASWLTPILQGVPPAMTLSPADTSPATQGSLHLERWSATSGSERGSRANLVLAGGGHRWRANADGNGAIDALMRAVDNALAPLLGPGVVLTAYDVHATRAGHEAKASVSVGVRRRDADDAPDYAGKAVDENVLQASVVAYIDAVNALLADEGVDIASAVPSPGETDRHDTDPEHRSASKDRIMSAYNS